MTDEVFDPTAPIGSLSSAKCQSELGEHIDAGLDYARWLSGYKTKVPGVPSADMYTATYNAMLPEVQKLQELQNYAERLSKVFVKHLEILKAEGNRSDEDYVTSCFVAVKILDLLVVLNFLKMYNASIMNDFAMFKRSFQQIRGDLPSDKAERVAQQSHSLHFFLVNPNSVVETLRIAVTQVQNYEVGMQGILELCSTTLGLRSFSSDVERLTFLRALLYTIFVTDSEGCNVFTLPKTKLAKPHVKSNPEVPVYGGISLTCLVVLKSTPHWEPGMEREWVGSEESLPCVCL